MTTQQRVPSHLRRFIVEQDYDAYDAVDQAVWRFSLLQMYERLQHSAHPAYVRGLSQAGMSVERIPRIEEMDEGLSRFGWGAVCVDGFIPPRAFFELQAHGILPIAADIRTPQHLAYTPAPDVIHEAAGHAPILPDPDYARFLRQVGEVGARAFASPWDGEVYQAIYRLSVEKERPDAKPEEVADAEQKLHSLLDDAGPPSEAALLSRFYWWTVEYGLVGSVDDYKLYGAGLLSSLAESHFCHRSEVEKIPLTSRCVEVDYDITSTQPQLFVVPELSALDEVLAEVSRPFAQCRGGSHGLRVAHESREVAIVELDTGERLTGTVHGLVQRDGEVQLALLPPSATLAPCTAELAHDPRSAVVLAVGRFADGTALTHFGPRQLGARTTAGKLKLVLEGGISIEGQLSAHSPRQGGRLGALLLEGARVLGAGVEHETPSRLRVVLAGEVTAVSAAGQPPGAKVSCSGQAAKRAPKRHVVGGERGQLLELYQRAQTAHLGEPDLDAPFRGIASELRRHPEAWLLRWNLLESLVRRGQAADLQQLLARELWQLEHRFGGSRPIASGLRYLGFEGPFKASR